MKKRIIAMLLTLAMLCALLPAAVLPAGAEVTLPPDEFDDDVVTGSCGENLTWTLDLDTGALSIEGSGPMDDYAYAFDTPWYEYRAEILTVTISDGVTSIGENAFDGCGDMTSITIPVSVTALGRSAFSGCTSLTDVYYGGNKAQWYAIRKTNGNERLNETRVHFAQNGDSGTCGEDLTWEYADGVLTIRGAGAMADYECEAPWTPYRDEITKLVVSDGCTSLGDLAFANLMLLTDVSLPETVERIGNNCFWACTALPAIDLPDGLTVLGEQAFAECSALESVVVPGGVDAVSYGAFADCAALERVTIGYGPERIESYAFADCTALTEVAIPDSVTYIGDAFRYCTALERVTIPGSVETIGVMAFIGCTGLTELTIEEGVTFIDRQAFNHCDSLTEVTIPDTVTELGMYAFASCSALERVSIPGSVTRICEGAFKNCASLTELTLEEGVTYIETSAFSGCTSLQSVTLPAGVPGIGYGVFSGCTSLQSVTLPVSVTEICAGAFFGCTALTDVYFCGTRSQWCAVTIEADNERLTGATIHFITDKDYGPCGENLWWEYEDGVLTITGTGDMNDYVERNDAPWLIYRDEITTVVVEEGCTGIGNLTFCYCPNLTSVSLPDSVVRLGFFCFRGCASLAELDLPENLTVIGDYALAETALQSVDLPAGITEIPYGLFSDCAALTSITIPEAVTSIGSFAFSHCEALIEIAIPRGVTQIGMEAFTFCGNLTDVYFGGTPAEWNAINIGVANEGLTGATIHYALCDHEHAHPEHKDATCTEPGYDRTLCDDCGGVLSEEILPALGHDYENHEAKAPTCTEGGWNAYQTCSRCDYTTYEAISKLGHDFKTSMIAPTCTEKGYTLYECTRCDYTEKGNWIDALGHEHAHPDHKEPTCTEDGYDRMICDDCGATVSETVIPALGHDLAIDPAKSATCTEAGLTEGGHCKRCDYAVAQEVVPALGHSFKDGVCTVCGAKDPDYKPLEPMKFKDVTEKDWFYDAVNYATSHGLMNGVDDGVFAPNEPMTRAMLVTVLWRYEDSPEAKPSSFTDLTADWYKNAVAWAAENGIVNGVGDGKFDPNGNITREQLAAILYRYAEKKGIDVSKHGDLSGFSDRTKVSAWAADAIAWTVGAELITGSDGKLDPQGNATRAQVATILMRFIEGAAKK